MKNKTKILIVACLALVLGGCVARNILYQWSPLKGNKDDGIVTLGYYYAPTIGQTPVANEQQGLNTATQTCRSWGYNTAVIYDIAQVTCTRYSGSSYSCGTYLVSRNYQCQ